MPVSAKRVKGADLLKSMTSLTKAISPVTLMVGSFRLANPVWLAA
jgi:hypothetical protein